MTKQEKIIQEVVKFLEFGPGEESYIREKFRAFALSVLPEKKALSKNNILMAKTVVNDGFVGYFFNQCRNQTKEAIEGK